MLALRTRQCSGALDNTCVHSAVHTWPVRQVVTTDVTVTGVKCTLHLQNTVRDSALTGTPRQGGIWPQAEC